MAWRSSGTDNKSLVANLKHNGRIQTKRVEVAMLTVDRANYAPTSPYQDSPQRIETGTTISAPHMHALVLESLHDRLVDGARVLDVGCGSGYLTACMGHMVGPTGQVVGIDHLLPLVNLSIKNIQRDSPSLLNSVVYVKLRDGWKGSPTDGPFDVIHVGAAAETLPTTLLDQLAPGGRMIVPVGGEDSQILLKIDKDESGELHEEHLCVVRFVSLTRTPDEQCESDGGVSAALLEEEEEKDALELASRGDGPKCFGNGELR